MVRDRAESDLRTHYKDDRVIKMTASAPLEDTWEKKFARRADGPMQEGHFFCANRWHIACCLPHEYAPNPLHASDAYGYSGRYPPMKLGLVLLLACAMFVSATPALADSRSDAKSQAEFGIHVAQKGLWREAIYRWEKAVELDPGYAAGFNDLAIGYEHEGQLDKARKAYDKALELEPNNSQIRQNYDLFKEINDRTSAGKEK
jgi:tetratricopeptide (TPR) repeat protein